MSRAGILLMIWGWLLLLPASAHVNSPYVVFEGRAGNFPVQVVVREPDVVPGLAQISVRVHQGSPTGVRVLPVHWNTDRTGSPRPDVAKRVAGETNRFTAALWLMARGAYGIEVEVQGNGGGTALVPVDSVAHVRKPLPSALGWVLTLLGCGLAAGMVAIAVAAAREATLPAGVLPGRSRWRMAAVAAALSTVAVAGMIYGGARWWSVEDQHHDTRVLYRQFEHEVSEVAATRGLEIRLRLTDPRQRQPANRLVPDHGQRVHLFLIAEQASTGIPGFAHLHPQENSDLTGDFFSPLPPLPTGRYRTFTELSHAAGMTQTLTNRLTVSASNALVPINSEDAWAPAMPDAGPSVDVGDDQRLSLRTESMRAGEPTVLKARVTRSDGSPVQLEPYLRMLGHAAVMRDDGTVFAHLHPAGSLSMASARVFATKLGGEAGAQAADANCGDLEAVPPAMAAELGRSGQVGFPWVFPQSGRYFVWIQVRTSGRIRTAPFEVTVGSATGTATN
jgi:hypothetical protein